MASRDIRQGIDALEPASAEPFVTGSRAWTEHEDAVIVKHFNTEKENVYKRLEGRSGYSCRARACVLGLTQKTNRQNREWSDEEDELLRRCYPKEGSKVFRKFRDRTVSECEYRVVGLGLEPPKRRIQWTAEEEEILIAFYPSEGPFVCFRLPNRNFSACLNRAKVLKLVWEDEMNGNLAKLGQAYYSGCVALLSVPKVPLIRGRDGEDKLCPNCGHPVSEKWPDTGLNNREWAMCQCPNCGQSLDESALLEGDEAEQLKAELMGRR